MKNRNFTKKSNFPSNSLKDISFRVVFFIKKHIPAVGYPGPGFPMVGKLKFWSNIEFFGLKFWSNIEFFWSKILLKIGNLRRPKFEFLTKISIFGNNYDQENRSGENVIISVKCLGQCLGHCLGYNILGGKINISHFL